MRKIEVSGVTREYLIALYEGLVEGNENGKAKKMVEDMTDIDIESLVENALITATVAFDTEIDERLENMFEEIK